ncbi:aspartyl/asparaginyl beta-hydroxylase domain-containing protein [Sphingomonas sp. G-3-2-10]|uniref:aspartyl/asparaginyl beta-hydroxylase domain-containing protein n=1 Tax=Sphingomonas sp. G-3-2-10 TaxID=2728838 RepID=UPI00146DC9EF|nr:aspartyl/asparaginyl beta-hydroxylase domain-containing protein [Sphingomonas sp. G-3-2-10]NML05312.1 aspartyl/asparaginyl beta-hydroxylase domain-containing protein [Sphingomonas sp. G-3-2-10]
MTSFEALTQSGVQAYRAGRGAEARSLFEQALALDPPPGARRPWIMLAQACRQTGDAPAEIAALENALRDEPRSLPALLLLGDRKRLDGDDRAATDFFQTALALAANQPPAPALAALIDTARRFMADAGKRFESHLTAGLADGFGGTRMQAAIDLLLGRTQLYLQQPSMFYFPGLPQRQFYERDEFPWLAELEAQAPAIRAELEAVLAGPQGFQPYIETPEGRPPPSHSLLDNPDWSAFFLWKDGAIVEENAARCPVTMAALAKTPRPMIEGWSPMGLFSVLRPGTHIQPHNGVLNTRLICHLPLIVPPGCGFRVGNETREWEEGKTLIFDDSFEHEAWNRGQSTRVVLLFEIWRPEITPEEQAALSQVFELIGEYQGTPDFA